jgi:hypothetical protein
MQYPEITVSHATREGDTASSKGKIVLENFAQLFLGIFQKIL